VLGDAGSASIAIGRDLLGTQVADLSAFLEASRNVWLAR
jgi:hypothetical protein